jgi:superfamily II DNA or RNA helicase
MAARFHTDVQPDQISISLVDRPLLGRRRDIAVAQWPAVKSARSAARALAALVTAGRADADETRVRLSHQEAAMLPAGIADVIGLPDLVPVSLKLTFDGRVEIPESAIRLHWADQDHREVRPRRTGLLLEWGDRRGRLTAPLLRLVEAIEAYNGSRGRAFEERVSTWMPVQESLRSTLGHEVKADGYAASLTIHQAGSFALDVRETQAGVDFTPILMARSKAANTEDDAPAPEDGEEPPSEDLHNADAEALLVLEDHREFLAQAVSRPGPTRDAYVLGRNRYVLIDPQLKKALDVVKQKRRAPAEERRQFVRNPRAALADAEEAEGVSSLFVETQQYSDRVLELGVWERPKLPWLTRKSHTWLPEGGWVDDRGAPADPPVLTDGERDALAQAVHSAREEGRPEVLVKGAPVPIEEAERLLKDHDADKPDRSPVGAAETEPEQKQVLLIKNNYDGVEYEQRLRRRIALLPAEPPVDRMGATRFKPHQELGFAWLTSAWCAGWPGVLLADDMGLGKTFQALAFLAWIRSNQEAARKIGDTRVDRGPILVVAPTALLKNWEEESARHLAAQGLGERVDAYGKCLRLLKVAPERRSDPGETLDRARLRQADWILTTYETLTDHEQAFAPIRYSLVLFDEMQKVKAPDTLNTKAAKTLNADFVLGLTGTPIENRLEDLWCIMDRLVPGYLGDLKTFSTTYREDAGDQLSALKRKLDQPVETAPAIMLRRMKDDVLEGLPEKREIRYQIAMPSEQQKAYERIVSAAQGSRSDKPGKMLKVIHDLRGVSLHPDRLDVAAASPDLNFRAFADRSARLLKTLEILRDIDAKGEKALVFIESLAMQVLFAEGVAQIFDMERRPAIINGGTPGEQRQRIVNEFQSRPPGFDLLVLSPKAAGVGLTITAANHVIHLSRWWNPAVEDQCNDRAFRIGQTKPVTVHLPIAIFEPQSDASFDKTLDDLLTAKRALSREMLQPPTSEHDVENLFKRTVGG